MPEFTLHDVPSDIWKPFEERAARDSWHLRSLVLQLMRDYGSGQISPTVKPSPKPYSSVTNFRCPHCRNAVTINLTKGDVPWMLENGIVGCPLCAGPIPLDEQQLAELRTWSKTPTLPSDPGLPKK